MPVQSTANPFENHQQLWGKKTAKGLYIAGIFSLTLATLWFLNEENWEVDKHTLWGIAIMILCSYPALVWAKQAKGWLPIFEVSMLLFIPQYALPLISHPIELRFYSDSTITKSAELIAFYLLISILGFSISNRTRKGNGLLLTPLVSNQIFQLSHLGVFISNIYLIISSFLWVLPADFQKILGTLFLGLSTVSIFITSRFWGLGLLNSSRKIFFLINVIINILISFTGLYLILGFSTIFLAIVSYSSAKKQIPWVAVSISILTISILHLGKPAMREKYWNLSSGRATQDYRLSIEEIPSFFSEWLNYGLQMERMGKNTNVEKHSSLDRAALFPMVCLAVDRIPREKNFLMGTSYTSIPVLFIPRTFWPEKPSALSANDELMIHLGLVNPDNITVNIAFGLPAEAYINFGFIGVGALGLFLGILYKKISLLSQNAPQFSPIGILSILLIASASQSGQNAAILVSTLFQMSVVCIGIPLIYKMLSSSSSPK